MESPESYIARTESGYTVIHNNCVPLTPEDHTLPQALQVAVLNDIQTDVIWNNGEFISLPARG